jgi:hypothetical protein
LGATTCETDNHGSGTFIRFNAGHCFLPASPASWFGTVASFYYDTITNGTVLTA